MTIARPMPGITPNTATPAKQTTESQNSQRWIRNRYLAMLQGYLLGEEIGGSVETSSPGYAELGQRRTPIVSSRCALTETSANRRWTHVQAPPSTRRICRDPATVVRVPGLLRGQGTAPKGRRVSQVLPVWHHSPKNRATTGRTHLAARHAAAGRSYREALSTACRYPPTYAAGAVARVTVPLSKR